MTTAELERLLGLSAGYLSKVRHGAVVAGDQLKILLALLARHPTLLRELGLRRPAGDDALRSAAAPRAPAPKRATLEWIARVVAGAFDDAGVRWAIGGATALAVHGVTRPTIDVDVFIHDDDRVALEILRRAGASVGKTSSDAFIAFPGASGAASARRTQPLVHDHADVVFARFEPLLSAVAAPERLIVDGASLPFLAVHHLCAAKLMSHSPKDEIDARALLDTGAVRPSAVRAALARAQRVSTRASSYHRFHLDRALAEARLAAHRRRTGAPKKRKKKSAQKKKKKTSARR